MLITVNKAKWDGLPEAARRLLQEVAIEHERESVAANLKGTQEQGQQMIDGGMKVVELTGAARTTYLEKAARSSWERMAKRDPTHVAALRQKFG